MFQNQYFPRPWHQMPQYTTSLVTVIHTSAPSPTSVSHIGYGSTFSTNYVNSSHPTSANYVGGTTLFTSSHSRVTSPTSIHHIGEDSLTSAIHDERMSPTVVNNACRASRVLDVLEVSLSSFAELVKEVILCVCV
jgi:hypothetical protein